MSIENPSEDCMKHAEEIAGLDVVEHHIQPLVAELTRLRQEVEELKKSRDVWRSLAERLHEICTRALSDSHIEWSNGYWAIKDFEALKASEEGEKPL